MCVCGVLPCDAMWCGDVCYGVVWRTTCESYYNGNAPQLSGLPVEVSRTPEINSRVKSGSRKHVATFMWILCGPDFCGPDNKFRSFIKWCQIWH